MSDFNLQGFKTYFLPPNYEIRLATKVDYWNIYRYELFSNRKVALFILFFGLLPLCLGLGMIIVFEPSLIFQTVVFFILIIILSYYIFFWMEQKVSKHLIVMY